MSDDKLIEVNKVVISDHQGMVCLTFEERTDRLTLTPTEAVRMGEAMSRQAYRAHFGDYPHNGSKQTIEQLRIQARNRVNVMLAQTIGDQADRMAKATQIVDEVMKLVA